MNGIPPVHIMQPSAKGARRQFSEALLGLSSLTDLGYFKTHLREIRERSLSEQASLAEQFKDSINRYPGIDCLWARDAAEAVNHINGIVRGTSAILVNRSSSVVNELMPGLGRLGCRIVKPYYTEFGFFENRIRDYWDLPDLLGKSLAGNFEVTGTESALPSLPYDKRTIKDCVALLGVSAASAEDGSIFFLQHSSNISKSLERAREIVLVVGLEKIVRRREDAVFQTRCMGIFGIESILLNLKPEPGEGDGIEDLPDYLGRLDRVVHVILLDNGRSNILQSDLRDLLLCIGCKACVKQCPINHSMSRNSTVWSPKDHLSMFLLGENPFMDMCLHCQACHVECPLSIDLPTLMWKAQALYATKHGRTLRDRILGNAELLAKVGAIAAPISNMVTEVNPGKMIVRVGLGLDARRQLPEFHHETFKQWFAKRRVRSLKAAEQPRVAYYVGCFANYYRPEVAKALVKVLEKNGIEVLVPSQKCCGMPMIANKNLRGFRKNAEYNIQSLAAQIDEGCDIVMGCPSCALMVKREYLSLCDSDAARFVSKHAYYVDEYLIRLKREGKLNIGVAKAVQSVFYHLPCHLRAQDGASDSLELVRSIPGFSVKNVNSTCCGMAGYHGYKKEHSDSAAEIGGKLFTEIKMAKVDRVITSCAACQLQIEAGTGIKASHPIQLLEEAYGLHEQP